MADRYIIRPAQQSDAAGIRRLIRQVGINPIGIHWPRFLVAVSSAGEVIATGQVKPHGDGSRELASIAVTPDWRNQGVASGIIRRLLLENLPPLYLTCRPGLQSFYERFGFRRLEPAEMPPYFRRLWRAASLAARILNRSPWFIVMAWDGSRVEG